MRVFLTLRDRTTSAAGEFEFGYCSDGGSGVEQKRNNSIPGDAVPAMKDKGGPWTERKLTAVRKYMVAFNNALKFKPTQDRPFRRIYIDAFAGSGSRELDHLPLLLNDADIAKIARGSARIALESDPPFDEYFFIEKVSKNAAELDALKVEFPQRRIEVRRQDANSKLVEIAQRWDSKRWRGVLFLDPYGCQVEWRTLTAIAATEAIDVWLLFPLNAVRRMMPNDAQFEKGWRERLDLLFGTTAWSDKFYPTVEAHDLFGSEHRSVRRVSLEGIEEFYRERLELIFRGGVCKKPLRLGASNREPQFSLFFACSNPSEAAKRTAHKIANDILKSS